MTCTATEWFRTNGGPADAAVEPVDLVLFPYAGGSPSAFRGWMRTRDGAVRTLVASLPGHGDRVNEPPVEHFDDLVRHLVDALEPQLSRRYAVFGHSLGAYLAFEIARVLPRPPVALFVSGAASPEQRTRERPSRSAMNDAELVLELRRLGGTPHQVLEHAELLDLLMPAIRADFALADSYRFRPSPALTCPIFALGGDRDPAVPPESLSGWLSHSGGPGYVRLFPGDHFFLHEHERALIGYVLDVLTRHTSSGQPRLGGTL